MRIEIRGDNVGIPNHTAQLLDRRARMMLGRLAGAIRDVRIVIRDENGPRRGIDQSCTVQMHLWRGAEVHVSADDESLQAALDRALDRARRATLRLIARQQERRRPDLGLRAGKNLA